MRLLFWTQLYLPNIGGIEVISHKLLLALRERGYTVCVVTGHGNLNLPDEDEYEGIPVHRFPFYQALVTRDAALMLQTQRRLGKLKEQFRPDIVHVNFSDPSVLFHLRTQGAGRSRLVVTFHITMSAELSGPETLLGTMLRSADWVTTVSAIQLAELRRAVPEVARSSSLIYYGLEPPTEPPVPPPQAPRLLCVGRLVAEKGVDVAIAAFASLADRFPTARLVIAGDGPVRAELQQQARSLGIADRTDFLGWVAPEEVLALMRGASVVLMPSRWKLDAVPLVMLQAALVARAVVATRVGGVAEFVVDGKTGILVDAEDCVGLARALAFMLERPDAPARMGSAARVRVLEMFGWERYVDEYDHLYRRLVTQEVYAGSR